MSESASKDGQVSKKKAKKISQGDQVMVIAGDDKGATGTVLKIMPAKDKAKGGRVIVEGVNILKKHRKPTQQDQEGGIIEEEGAIHISNVKKVSAEAS